MAKTVHPFIPLAHAITNNCVSRGRAAPRFQCDHAIFLHPSPAATNAVERWRNTIGGLQAAGEAQIRTRACKREQRTRSSAFSCTRRLWRCGHWASAHCACRRRRMSRAQIGPQRMATWFGMFSPNASFNGSSSGTTACADRPCPSPRPAALATNINAKLFKDLL